MWLAFLAQSGSQVHCQKPLSKVVHASHDAGVQIATKQIDEGIAAGLMAAEAGATWLDLNCGCPIYGALAHSTPCA